MSAAIKGDLRKFVADEWRQAGRAIRAGLREGGRGLRDGIVADARGAGLGKLAKVWRVRVYGGRRGPWESTAFIYPRGGERTRGALWAFEHGATIRSTGSRYLLIPTSFNRKGGKVNGKVLYQPGDLQGTFVQKSKDGSLLLFAKVGRAQAVVGGRVRDRAYVNDQLLGSGRVGRTKKILEAGAVPMFVLVPQTRINKRTNISSLSRKWEARLPELILKNWRVSDGA